MPTFNGCDALSEVAGAGDLALLPQRAGKHFDLGADTALVVSQTLQSDADGIVLVAAVIAKQNGRSPGLGDQDVVVAIAVVIGNGQRARIEESDLVEARLAW